MQDPLGAIIREAMSGYPVPRTSPTAISDVLAARVRYEASQRHKGQLKQRALLTCYWVCASFGIAAVLSSIPLPHWRPAALTTWTAWAVPAVGALWLCRGSIIGALRNWSTRYLLSTYGNFERTR
jgi:hypothetical protein